MTAPGAAPRPKFRIDPTAPPAPPSPPAAPAPPPAPTAPRPPPASSPRPPAPGPARRTPRWLIPAIVGVVILLAGAAVAVFYFGVGGLVYPQKYLLAKSEAPRGMVLSDPEFASQETQCEKNENPCQLTSDALDQLGQIGKRPKEAWVEGFDIPSQDGAPVTIVAMKFASKDDANAWASRATPLCSPNGSHGALLQDDDVIVAFTARGDDAGVYKDKAVTALKAKASGLRTLCTR